MTKEDIADFISGERSVIESAINNLNNFKAHCGVDELTLLSVTYWTHSLNSINVSMSNFCDCLRRR